jgi:hypothetical protein
MRARRVSAFSLVIRALRFPHDKFRGNPVDNVFVLLLDPGLRRGDAPLNPQLWIISRSF